MMMKMMGMGMGMMMVFLMTSVEDMGVLVGMEGLGEGGAPKMIGWR